MTEPELSMISTLVSALVLAPAMYEDLIGDARHFAHSEDLKDALWALETVFRDHGGVYDGPSILHDLNLDPSLGARMAHRSLSFHDLRLARA